MTDPAIHDEASRQASGPADAIRDAHDNLKAGIEIMGCVHDIPPQIHKAMHALSYAVKAAAALPTAPEPGWLQPALDSAAKRANAMPDWMVRRDAAPPAVKMSADAPTFQRRAQDWMMATFSMEVCRDTIERNHRFLEEALELVQALGCTASEAHQLVDYVYGRDQGEVNQEIGGVMVTLAALCLANDLDMHQGGETELARVWTKIDQIRAKQASKPKHSPLPQTADAKAEPLRSNNVLMRDIADTFEKVRIVLRWTVKNARKVGPMYSHANTAMWALTETEKKLISILAAPPAVDRAALAQAIRKALIENWREDLGAKWDEDVLLTGCRKVGGGRGYQNAEEAAQNLALDAADAVIKLLPTDVDRVAVIEAGKQAKFRGSEGGWFGVTPDHNNPDSFEYRTIYALADAKGDGK